MKNPTGEQIGQLGPDSERKTGRFSKASRQAGKLLEMWSSSEQVTTQAVAGGRGGWASSKSEKVITTRNERLYKLWLSESAQHCHIVCTRIWL